MSEKINQSLCGARETCTNRIRLQQLFTGALIWENNFVIKLSTFQMKNWVTKRAWQITRPPVIRMGKPPGSMMYFNAASLFFRDFRVFHHFEQEWVVSSWFYVSISRFEPETGHWNLFFSEKLQHSGLEMGVWCCIIPPLTPLIGPMRSDYGLFLSSDRLDVFVMHLNPSTTEPGTSRGLKICTFSVNIIFTNTTGQEF